jgi:hypothetical protein
MLLQAHIVKKITRYDLSIDDCTFLFDSADIDEHLPSSAIGALLWLR